MQFRTKARAVDLLGKGQIADLPTAITELWKNGYDAYADNLSAEIYLGSYKDVKSPLFVMTDDGKGMSRKDIFEKWLVLGTDSKSRTKVIDIEGEDTLWKKPRIKAGEKGIGRLSVAYLGNPMLMLTKKQGHPLQALFFDWRLLENYNLFLDDVNIPVVDIENIDDFQDKFDELKTTFLDNFEKKNDADGELIWEESQSKLRHSIQKSVLNCEIPQFLNEKHLNTLIDPQQANGTKFFVFEPIDQIIDLPKQDEDTLEDRQFLMSSLSGFTNDFIFDNKVINTTIPIFKDEDNYEIDFLTSQGNFFTSKDFDLADILIDGSFDGKGEFTGTLKIYDEIIDHHYINPRKKDSRNFYGKFPIKLGYSQGFEKSSRLDEVSFKKIGDKVYNYGGLYIYRDNFRVLPYGRENADFLRFDKRRSKRAGTFYFSYRRMFGYLGLSRSKNEKLKDKSSREGLINNGAYRAFENDLISFFVDLAEEYFGDKAKQSIFLDKKEELNKQHEVLSRDNRRAIEEKKAFTRSLKDYPTKLDKYQTEYIQLLKQLEKKIIVSDVLYSDIESILDRLQTLDIEFKNLIPKIPKRYKPTDTQLDRLDKYEVKLIAFTDTVKKDSVLLMTKVKEKLEVKELKMEFTRNYQKFNGALEKTISTNRKQLKTQFDKLSKDFSFRTRRIIDDLNFDKDNVIASIDSKTGVLLQSERLESKFNFLREQIDKEITPLIDHLNKLSFDIDEELVQGAYKAEYETIKYKWEQTRETAQLGVAVEIIDHEFNVLYSRINKSLEKLSLKGEVNDVDQFKLLEQNFSQLEDKYDTLSPLYRAAGVIPKPIIGTSLSSYLQKFFSNRFESYNIEVETTAEFDNHTILIKEPVIHTVYINVINNAIYWMRNKEKRKLFLDYRADTNEIIICNSGFKIEDRRLEKIFELFYSNRPNGRGIGLYLSKQSLNESDFDIYATNDKEYNVLNGACFVIKNLQ